MVKEQETIPNKELLKELDVFRLEKNGLGRQKSYILKYLICSPGKRDETWPDKPKGRIDTKATKLILARAQRHPQTNAQPFLAKVFNYKQKKTTGILVSNTSFHFQKSPDLGLNYGSPERRNREPLPSWMTCLGFKSFPSM